MPRLFFLSILFCTISTVYASPGDTTSVRAHNATHMNWYGNFDKRAGFPGGTTTYQKILLRYTLGCPSSGCSEWDYTTRVFVLRPTGQTDTSGNAIKEEVELCRVITPYAGTFANSWKWTYTFDVTDYASMLKDSTDIRVQYQGYQDGFTATLDFEFVEGTPPHPVLDVLKIYEGGSSYGDPNNPIENFLSEKPVQIPSGTQYAKFMYRPSGHGFGGNENCAEFCPKYFYVKTDNQQRGQSLIWNETCGLNPLFPQPGTWLYDRANWCPGGPTGDFTFNLTPYLAPGAHTLNVDMEPFTNVNNNNCSYNISAQLFLFGSPSFTNDAEVVEILGPNKNPNYGRFNPICHEASVIIRNTGAQNLQQLKLGYKVENGTEYTVTWTGNLAFLETDTFRFPVADWSGANQEKKFTVRVLETNNQADEYLHNNAAHSYFAIPPVYPAKFVLNYKTNGKPAETSCSIRDAQGNLIFSRNSHTANTEYKDTLEFANGCYRFEFLDAGKNGLSFYSFNNDGAGFVRFRRAESISNLRTFNPNFGTSILHYFTVGGTLSTEEPSQQGFDFELFPNPADHYVDIQLRPESGNTRLILSDASGKRILAQENISTVDMTRLDVSSLSPGVYFIQITASRGTAIKKFIRK